MKNDNDDNKEDGETLTAHVKGGEAQRLIRETVTVVGPEHLW